jgi:hypothetical protein
MLLIMGIVIAAVGYDSPHSWQAIYGLPFIVGQFTYELICDNNNSLDS